MDNEVQVLPKVCFKANSAGNETVKVIDRHGVNVTTLFLIQEISFSLGICMGRAEVRMVFIARRWNVDCPDGIVSKLSAKNDDGYDLTDGLEINSIRELYPPDSTKKIEITFDAEWDG